MGELAGVGSATNRAIYSNLDNALMFFLMLTCYKGLFSFVFMIVP